MAQRLLHPLEQVGIRWNLLTGLLLLQEVVLVGLHAKEVDERVVGALVGEEEGMESRFAECCNQALLLIDAVEVLSRGP